MSTCCGRLKRKMPRCCPRPEHYSEATMFPHNIGLGCASDPDLMRRIGRVTALELRAVGFTWNLAPITAVSTDYRRT
ncbi:unnamed protein product [Vitrella brassicaformis CCMP3155]|uniref:beta-glucosidase n=1 Tax=Vitrella brassicaformis (strain CCMP3155) TaxID=1169540 RepID=A0A0G4H0P0_VITBC|nr:unnamed protein product [Vitrella brassicaformis CCMP3155]|eukprot:CEM36980.1 unnamed protein product [Vitrella brassicaformis CCMP3155]